MKKHSVLFVALVAASLSLLTGSISAAESPAPLKKEKLQIVFCFGQSNMVGLAAVPTAWYLSQPSYVEKGTPEHEKALLMNKRATSNKGFHCHGSAKFFLLTGDAMARSLANLMAGGKPMAGAAPTSVPEGQ